MNYLLKKETELIENSLSYYVPHAYDLAIRECGKINMVMGLAFIISKSQD